MERSARLQLIGRITYYVGWITLLCGGLVQLNIAKNLFMAISLTKRNLFEVSIVCFVICIASEVRALESAKKQIAGVVNRQVAA
ncbi:MAG: hypothetical protein WB562_03445 [Candidatus Sulfotelmatobacter sp.]